MVRTGRAIVGKWAQVKVRVRRKQTRRLMVAILGGDVATVRAVLRSGIDPAMPDRYGTTPLYHASVQGEAEIARLLLKAGARPDVESGLDRSPVHPLGGEGSPLCAAAAHGHLDVIRMLLKFGADPNLREDDGLGCTALDWAVRFQEAAVADEERAMGAAVASALSTAGARSTDQTNDGVGS